MLLSMTGFGEAHLEEDGYSAAVEIRTVNSRYFKAVIRLPEGYSSLEPMVDSTVRQRIKRGTVTVVVRVERKASPDDYQINDAVLGGYRQQIGRLSDQLGMPNAVDWDSLLALPGVVDERSAREVRAEEDWPRIEQLLGRAMDRVWEMRQQEGRAMAEDLAANCEAIRLQLEKVEVRAPTVAESYRTRLTERLNVWLRDHDITVEAADVVREVGIFADRCDISEEIVRLRSHLDQFAEILRQSESAGRKLEFITQEMFRETNTIGSKANDTEIAQHVIEVKACIERMREMIQNVE
jgi:uncharacterized protein (TIGR00255 family)